MSERNEENDERIVAERSRAVESLNPVGKLNNISRHTSTIGNCLPKQIFRCCGLVEGREEYYKVVCWRVCEFDIGSVIWVSKRPASSPPPLAGQSLLGALGSKCVAQDLRISSTRDVGFPKIMGAGL